MQLLKPEVYQSELVKRFDANKPRLLALCPDARVEHIGSSAVRGALSKGDLDICLAVSPSQLEATVAILKDNGYSEQTDTLRTTELCMLVNSNPNNEHALQVVAAGSSFECFIWFRDLLINHPELVQRYNEIKIKSSYLPEEKYRAAKSLFIEEVISSSEYGKNSLMPEESLQAEHL